MLNSIKENLNSFSCCSLNVLKTFIYDHQKICITVGALAVSYKVMNFWNDRKLRQKWDSAGKDVVVLHASGPSKTTPHASPFALKLDMFLIMAGIPFKHDSKKPFGPKGKIPWITLNGEDIADSQVIVDFLNVEFDKDLNYHLTKEEKAIATSMRIMIEEHLLWGIGWWRFFADREYHFLKSNRIPWSIHVIMRLGFIRRKIASMLWAQGVGRHSDDILMEMMWRDIEAVAVFLGEKKFIMGDEPCELDCTVFGFFATILWGLQGNPWIEPIRVNHPNITRYCNRIKDEFYPNWEQRLLKVSKL